MSRVLAYARDLLVSIGLIRADGATPLASLFGNLPGHHRILISGLDVAGKSTLLRGHLAPHEKYVSDVMPMIGFNIEVYRCDNATFQVIDLGYGRPKLSFRVERAFFRHADAVIWVIDASDHDRYIESREELFGPLSHENGLRKDIPVLILANKQDIPYAWNTKQTENFLANDISSPLVNRPYKVFGTNTKTGEGLGEAFRWLSENVESRMKYDTGISEKTPLYDKEEEVGIIVMEGINQTNKAEVYEKSG